MVLTIKSPLSDDKIFKINNLEDFAPLFDLFPQLKGLSANHKDIHLIGRIAKDYLTNGHINVELDDQNELEPIEYTDETHKPKDVKKLSDMKEFLENDSKVEKVLIPTSEIYRNTSWRTK